MTEINLALTVKGKVKLRPCKDCGNMFKMRVRGKHRCPKCAKALTVYRAERAKMLRELPFYLRTD